MAQSPLELERILQSRFPALDARPAILARPMLALLKRLLREDEINAFLKGCEGAEGLEFVDRVLEHFDFTYTVVAREVENIPAEGRVVIVANHPLGVLDGAALLKLVGQVRRDVRIVVNDVLGHFAPARALLLPVVNLGRGSNRRNVDAIHAALEREQAVIVFPSGEVARAGPFGIRDARWRSGFLRFAERANAPVLPVHLAGRNSALFYGVSTVFRPLSTLMLLREPHARRNTTLRIRIGAPIAWKDIAAAGASVESRIQHVYRAVHDVPRNRIARMRARKPVAHPEDRLELRRDLRGARALGQTADGKAIYLFDSHGDSAVMRELGRLRELAFRAAGEGTGKRRDIDAFDAYYRHVVLWDEAELQIVGAYRIGDVASILPAKGADGLYSHGLFAFEDDLRPHLAQSLELGRSFVQPRYQGLRALEHLWNGIGAYLRTRPDVHFLFGPVSLSAAYPEPARRLLVYFYRRYFGTRQALVTPRNPFVIPEPDEARFARLVPGDDYVADFRALKRELARMGLSMPPLYKQYTELCEPGGARFLGFSTDPLFADCVDGLVLVDLLRMKPEKRARYLGMSVSAHPSVSVMPSGPKTALAG